jgi:TolA-binding protein
MRLCIIPLALAALAGPALAQVDRVPEQSRSERQVNEINRSLTIQQQDLRQNQQTQFEINQLRGQIQRDSMVPPAGRICAPGQINC